MKLKGTETKARVMSEEIRIHTHNSPQSLANIFEQLIDPYLKSVTDISILFFLGCSGVLEADIPQET